MSGCAAPTPPPDTDGDGLIDQVDKCPRQDGRGRDANRDGCLDPLKLLADAKLKYLNRSNGIRVRSLKVDNVVRGSRVRVRCSRGCRPRVYKVKRNGSLPITHLKRKSLRARSRLTVEVTQPGAIGRLQIYTIKRGDAAKRTYCLRPGSATARQKC